MKIKCVVACKNSEGAPDFYSCTVNCSNNSKKFPPGTL